MSIGKELGNKLSAKSFGWDKEAILEAVMKDKASDVFLYRIGGSATGLRKYKSDVQESGEGYGLSGAFKGVGSDGEVKLGSVAYLPKYVHEMVEAALTLSDDVAAVNIGFDIYARYDNTSATSYRYVARDVLNEGSPADAVMDKVMTLPMPGTPEAKALTDQSK